MSAFVRLLLAGVGRPLLERSLPTYLVLGIIAGVVFGGNGLHPSTVTDAAVSSWTVRAALFGGWLLVTLPAGAAIFTTGCTFFLRTLPVPPSYPVGACLGLLLLLQTPWAVLWMVGSGALWAAAATLALVAGTVLAVARLRDRWDLAATVSFVASLVIGSAALLLLTSGLALLVASPRAWRRAPERACHPPRALVFGPSLLALVLAYLVSLLRGHRTVVVRAGMAWLGATVLGLLVVDNNGLTRLDEAARLLMALACVATLVVTATLAVPLERIARHNEDVVTVGGAPHWLRGAATRVALLSVGAVSCGGMVGIVCWAAPLSATTSDLAAVLVAALVAGGASGVLATAVAEVVRPTGGRAAGWFILALLVLVIGTVITTLSFAPLVASLVLAGAAATVGWGTLDGRGARATRTEAESMLKLTEVSKRLGDRLVLSNVSLGCEAGEVVVVTGANGSGKSTLLRIAAGLLQPDRGTVVIAGYPMAGGGVAARRRLGYVADGLDAFPDLMVSEFVALVGALKGAPKPDHGQLRLQLGVDAIWHQRLSTLSLGQRKRTALWCALLGAPSLLVLDEPSNGLDRAGVTLLTKLITAQAARGLAALVATNDGTFEGALAGRGVRLSDGALAAA